MTTITIPRVDNLSLGAYRVIGVIGCHAVFVVWYGARRNGVWISSLLLHLYPRTLWEQP